MESISMLAGDRPLWDSLFQAADYLPRIFGAHRYALLPKPELLPTVLLDWMRRLLTC